MMIVTKRTTSVHFSDVDYTGGYDSAGYKKRNHDGTHATGRYEVRTVWYTDITRDEAMMQYASVLEGEGLALASHDPDAIRQGIWMTSVVLAAVSECDESCGIPVVFQKCGERRMKWLIDQLRKQ